MLRRGPRVTRRSARLTIATAVWTAVFICAVPERAEAYVDPGVGNYFVQLLIAGIVGGLYAVKLGWARIVTRSRQLAERLRRGRR